MKADRRIKTRKLLTGALAALIAATLAFMWGNSLKSRDVSKAQSDNVLPVVEPCLEIVVGEGNVTEQLVRKLAHVSEYAALGCELALLCALRRRVRRQPVLNASSAGLAAAVADEALQIVSGRGPLVQDILLDFAAFLTVMAFVLSIRALYRLVRRIVFQDRARRGD
jgi:VanZ family protein